MLNTHNLYIQYKIIAKDSSGILSNFSDNTHMGPIGISQYNSVGTYIILYVGISKTM